MFKKIRFDYLMKTLIMIGFNLFVVGRGLVSRTLLLAGIKTYDPGNFVMSVLIILLILLIGSFIFDSPLLGYANYVFLILASGVNITSSVKTYYVSTLILPLIITLLLLKAKKRDSLLDFFSLLEKPGLTKSSDIILHDIALYCALSSLSLFILNTIYIFSNYKITSYLVYGIIFNIIVSVATVILARSLFPILILGITTPLSLISSTPLLYTSYNTIVTEAVEYPGISQKIPLKKGIFLGKTIAKLTYGYPKKESEISRYNRKYRAKTWYWKEVSFPLVINLDELPNKHIIITGASGTGKSTIAKHLAKEFYDKKFHIIIIDPHGEYRELADIIPEFRIVDASLTYLNPLELGSLSPRERAHQLAFTIQSIFGLGPIQRQALEDLFIETYKRKGIFPDNPETWSNKPPNFSDVIGVCEDLMKSDEVYNKLFYYIKTLATNVFSTSSKEYGTILRQSSIIVLNRLTSDYVRILYVTTLLQRLADTMYTSIRKDTLFIIDEAHILLRKSIGKHLVSKLFMESRKYGIGVILISQQPLLIPDSVFQNASLRLIFNTSEPRNVEYLVKLLTDIYEKEKMNAIRTAIKNIKHLHFIFSQMSSKTLYIVHLDENIIVEK